MIAALVALFVAMAADLMITAVALRLDDVVERNAFASAAMARLRPVRGLLVVQLSTFAVFLSLAAALPSQWGMIAMGAAFYANAARSNLAVLRAARA